MEREDQTASLQWTPPRWLIDRINQVQRWAYEKSDGRLWTRAAGMRHLLLRTIGRKTGLQRVACLPYWIDLQGHPIVVASYAGNPRHPAWFQNLADRQANPEVIVRDGRRVYAARAEVLEGEERAGVWKELVADRPFYETYQTTTERVIPLVRLVATRELRDSTPKA